jgi:hypothetical protein
MIRGASSEGGIERGLADSGPRRRFANSEALSHKRASAPELFVRHNGLASALATARYRRVESGAGSLADEVALELSKRAKNMEDEPSAWRCGVDRFSERAEADTPRFQGVHRLDQMRQRAAEAIKLPYRQNVAVPHEAQRGIQSGSVGFGSGRLVFEYARATGLGESVEL